MSDPSRVLLWARPDQASLVNQAIAAAGLTIAGAGSADPDAGVELCRMLGAERFDDLRQAVHRDDFDMVWLAAPEALDDELRRLLGERNTPVFSSEPQLGSLADLADAAPGSPIVQVPQMKHSPGYEAALDVLAQFGEPQCVNIFFRSGGGQGTLFARLFDAVDVLHLLCGPIERINAGLAGALSDVPDDLMSLRGHMTVNVRFKANRCACLALSDCAGAWFRGVTVLGAGGCLRIHDNGFEWVGLDGRLIDSHKHPGNPTAGELVGREIRRRIENRAAAEPPPDHVFLLAMCEAARLSCLTGQDESPAKLVQMLSRL